MAGVTLKTLRHYHKIGLLDEPARLENGYRDYGVSHVVRLLRIRQLARLGLPLARIKERLDAEGRVAMEGRPKGGAVAARVANGGLSGESAAALGAGGAISAPKAGETVVPGVAAISPRMLDELDASLAEQIALLEEQRHFVASIRSHPEDFDLPAPLRAHVGRLRELGASDALLAFERGGLLLTGSLYGSAEVSGTALFYDELFRRGELGRYLSLSERLLNLAPDVLEGERAELVLDAIAFATPLLAGLGAGPVLWESRPADRLVDDYESCQLNAAQADVSARIWQGLVSHFAGQGARP